MTTNNKYPEVNMPCKRGQDLLTKGTSCDSKMAYNMSPSSGSNTATFKCVKCNYTWSVALGGQFNIP